MTEKDVLNNKNKNNIELFSNIRFLIVDDYAVNQEMLKYFIESVNGIVFTAGDGQIAVEMFKENAPDIIIMDIQMPEMDGFEATREIRKLPGGNKIPIIGLSANVLEKDKKDCFTAGMNGFIPKPLDFKYFLTVVEQCLDKVKNTADIEEQKLIEPASKKDYKDIQNIPIDIEAYVIRMGGNREIAESIIKGFIRQIPIELNNIKQAISSGDTKTVDRVAHSIKGGSSNVFAEGLMQAARELEMHAKADRLDDASQLLEKIRKEFEKIQTYVDDHINLF